MDSNTSSWIGEKHSLLGVTEMHTLRSSNMDQTWFAGKSPPFSSIIFRNTSIYREFPLPCLIIGGQVYHSCASHGYNFWSVGYCIHSRTLLGMAIWGQSWQSESHQTENITNWTRWKNRQKSKWWGYPQIIGFPLPNHPFGVPPFTMPQVLQLDVVKKTEGKSTMASVVTLERYQNMGRWRFPEIWVTPSHHPIQ